MSKVLQADIVASSNVIIHNIDTFLQLPVNVTTTDLATGKTAIVDALKNIDLDDISDTTADLTVFIPSNKAFEVAHSIIQGADMQTSGEVLSYHAVFGDVLFLSELCSEKLKTVEGSEVTVSVADDKMMIDGAAVVVPDVIVSMEWDTSLIWC